MAGSDRPGVIEQEELVIISYLTQRRNIVAQETQAKQQEMQTADGAWQGYKNYLWAKYNLSEADSLVDGGRIMYGEQPAAKGGATTPLPFPTAASESSPAESPDTGPATAEEARAWQEWVKAGKPTMVEMTPVATNHV